MNIFFFVGRLLGDFLCWLLAIGVSKILLSWISLVSALDTRDMKQYFLEFVRYSLLGEIKYTNKTIKWNKARGYTYKKPHKCRGYR